MQEATIWNPFDARSPLRSARVQAAFLVLVQTGFAAFGVQLGDELLGRVVAQGSEVLAGATVLWGLLGTIRASRSARPF